jgi:hypothetical protein
MGVSSRPSEPWRGSPASLMWNMICSHGSDDGHFHPGRSLCQLGLAHFDRLIWPTLSH